VPKVYTDGRRVVMDSIAIGGGTRETGSAGADTKAGLDIQPVGALRPGHRPDVDGFGRKCGQAQIHQKHSDITSWFSHIGGRGFEVLVNRGGFLRFSSRAAALQARSGAQRRSIRDGVRSGSCF